MLNAAEIRRHERVDGFAACSQYLSWVHTRGRMHPDSTDGGRDLVLMQRGGSPRVVWSQDPNLSGATWSPSGEAFVVHSGGWLLLGRPADSLVPKRWLKLPAGESFCAAGGLVWASEDVVLYSTSGGTPKVVRLYGAQPSVGSCTKQAATGVLLFAAEQGGMLLGYDHAPGEGIAAVIHQRANAMLAEVLIVPGLGSGLLTQPRVVAIDGRVEYCKPQVAFLRDGTLVARMNLAMDHSSKGLKDSAKTGDCATIIDANSAIPPAVTHGVYILSFRHLSSGATFTVVDIAVDGKEFGSYDVCSNSYGAIGARNGFILDAQRQTIVVTARGHQASASDNLWIADLLSTGQAEARQVQKLASPKGCHVPVFLGSDGELVYHFRSPTEWGDLWVCDSNAKGNGAGASHDALRLTHTMPLSLSQKLFEPVEVIISNEGKEPGGAYRQHALVFSPPSSSSSPQELQPLVWIHGGPMAMVAFDYNPFLCWLASLGYVVCVPNFRGSTGFGVQHMDAVLGAGCGVADLSDCRAAAEYLRSLAADDARVDLRRGVGVAGHSWGGYLTLMSMTEPSGAGDVAGGEMQGCFSCGVALAGIADWFVQQRHTEVRYYDYALMGGWVYEAHVAQRAKAASPHTRAGNLRAPLMVLHGDKDTDVPYQQIVSFVEAASRSQHAGASVEFRSFEGEGHGISGTKAEKEVLEKIQTFLRVNLKPWDFTANPHGDVTAY